MDYSNDTQIVDTRRSNSLLYTFCIGSPADHDIRNVFIISLTAHFFPYCWRLCRISVRSKRSFFFYSMINDIRICHDEKRVNGDSLPVGRSIVTYVNFSSRKNWSSLRAYIRKSNLEFVKLRDTRTSRTHTWRLSSKIRKKLIT